MSKFVLVVASVLCIRLRSTHFYHKAKDSYKNFDKINLMSAYSKFSGNYKGGTNFVSALERDKEEIKRKIYFKFKISLL